MYFQITGINDVMVRYLKGVAGGLSAGDRCCAIMFDEIFLMPGEFSCIPFIEKEST